MSFFQRLRNWFVNLFHSTPSKPTVQTNCSPSDQATVIVVGTNTITKLDQPTGHIDSAPATQTVPAAKSVRKPRTKRSKKSSEPSSGNGDQSGA